MTIRSVNYCFIIQNIIYLYMVLLYILNILCSMRYNNIPHWSNDCRSEYRPGDPSYLYFFIFVSVI